MASVQPKMEALHLFRGLLRAASYLPDEFARTYIHDHIIYRFRNAAQITPNRLLIARRETRRLQRAAEGDIKPLLLTLNMTYGRAGKRRRELVNRLYGPDAALYKEDIEATRTASQNPPSTAVFEGRTRFEQVICSQSRHHPSEALRNKIRDVKPIIPKGGTWDRPLPLKRQANIKKRFLAATLDKVLPPMPQGYWNRLRDLAMGVIPFQPPPPRRKSARSLSDNELTGSETTMLQLPLLNQHSIVPGRDPRHRITPRFMRRMWAIVWANSNVMLASEEGQERWDIIWGGGQSAAAKGLIAAPGISDLEFFEGLDKVQERRSKANGVKSCARIESL